jgi:hypothetical protein
MTKTICIVSPHVAGLDGTPIEVSRERARRFAEAFPALCAGEVPATARVVEGAYLGSVEPSVMLECDGSADDGAELAALAVGAGLAWGQESVLVVVDGVASLVFLDDRDPVEIGQWREVPAELARQANAYTKVGDVFYVAGPAEDHVAGDVAADESEAEGGAA